jgi:hypothetical protein
MHESKKLPCYEKLSFDTKKQANTARLVAELQHNAKLKTYKCVHCGLWHLSSQD